VATAIAAFTPAQKRVTMAALMVVFLLGALDQTVVSTAMPRIIAQLQGLHLYAWVTTAYMLTSTVMVPIYGKLGDQFGRKPILVTGIVIFLVGSWLCGLSESMLQLIGFRALQGLGGAALFTSAFAIIADMYSPTERGKMGGLFGAVFGLSSVLGPVIGGFFTDHGTVTLGGHEIHGWRWVFYVNLPLGLLSLFMLLTRMPRIHHEARGKVDLLGAALVIGSTAPLLLALTWGGQQYAWGSATILGLFAFSAACLVGLLFAERYHPDAIIPLGLFRNPVFARANMAAFVIGMAFLGVVMFLPLFMQLVQGVSATRSGLSMLPLMAGLMLSSIVSGQLVARTGRYKPYMLGGGVLLVAGVWCLARIGVHTSTIDLGWRMFLVGLGLGPSQSLYNLAIQNAVAPEVMGVATSSSQFFRQIGSTIGVAIFGTLLTHHLAVELPKHLPAMPAAVVQHVDMGQLQAIAAQQPHQAASPQQRAIAEATKEGFAAAIAKMFGTSLWIILLGFLVTLTIPAWPMRERVPHSRMEEVEESLAGQALPAEVDPGAYPRAVQPPRRPPVR
jgi:EmrB/QacA subfamily drug resistance transporter